MVDPESKISRLLREDEVAVLNSFFRQLPPHARELFGRQLNRVGVVQREGGGSSVNFYSKKLFGAKQLDCESFPGLAGETLVAVCKSALHGPSSLKSVAKIWFVEGRLFSIEFKGGRGAGPTNDFECGLSPEFRKLVAS